MNVAIFASSFHPHVGGVEELVRQLARDLRLRGHEPIVVTNRWPPELPAEETVEEIPTYRVPMRIPEGPLRARAKFALTHRELEAQVCSILRSHQTELVHVQCVSSNGYYARHAARALDLPLVVTSQGERTMDATRIYERSPFLNRVLGDLLDNADFVTACSQDTLDDLERYRGQPFGARAAMVPNGISLADFDAPDAAVHQHLRPYALGIGRLVPQKGFDVLIRAFASLVVDPDFEHDLLLAGDGAERRTLTALIDELSLQGRAHLVGPADRATTVALFKGCSFFVLPSRREPFGIVNLEAMAAGKPVIASAVGGVPEIVRDGHNGVLVPDNDVAALAAAMSRLAESSALRERFGHEGRRIAEDFAWPRVTDLYEAVYDAVRQPHRAALTDG